MSKFLGLLISVIFTTSAFGATFFAPGTVQQVTQISTVADVSGNLQDTTLNLYSAKDTTHYVIWLNVDGAGTLPSIPGADILEVDLVSNSSDTDNASALAGAITGMGADFTASVSGNTVTLKNGSIGPTPAFGASTPASDISTGFTVTTLVTGSDTDPTDTCTAGDQRYDANFHYDCVATNSWKRSATKGW